MTTIEPATHAITEQNPASSHPTLSQDLAKNGDFLLSHYGAAWALGFRGPPDFIERGFNLAQNRSIIGLGARLNWFYGRGGPLAYVVVPRYEKLVKGLTSQFHSEIISEIVAKGGTAVKIGNEENGFEANWDEELIECLASDRVKSFMENEICMEEFMSQTPQSIAPIYGMAQMVAAEQSGE